MPKDIKKSVLEEFEDKIKSDAEKLKDTVEDKVEPKEEPETKAEPKEEPKAEDSKEETKTEEPVEDKPKEEKPAESETKEDKLPNEEPETETKSSDIVYGTEGVYTLDGSNTDDFSEDVSHETEEEPTKDTVTKSETVSSEPDVYGDTLSAISKSYDVMRERQDSVQKSVDALSETITSYGDVVEELKGLLPQLTTVVKSLVNDGVDTVTEKVEPDADPEEVATKSANLEDEQHAEKISKSTDAKEPEADIAKNDDSDAVSEVISKSKETEPEVEKSTKVEANVLSDEDVQLTARGKVGAFQQRFQDDIRKGFIPENSINVYTDKVSNVIRGNASREEAEAFIAYADHAE